jgi:hypothetical protein
MSSHDFIDDPKFGHTRMKLPVILVPVVMFGVLLLELLPLKSMLIQSFIRITPKNLLSNK